VSRNHLLRLLLIPLVLIAVGFPGLCQTFWFDGVFRDTPYGSLQDGLYNMRLAVYSSSEGGVRLWPVIADYEEHAGVVVSDGSFQALLGSQGQPVPAGLADWPDAHVQVAVCGEANAPCAEYEPLPIRLPLSSHVPLSLETPLPEEEESYEVVETWEDAVLNVNPRFETGPRRAVRFCRWRGQ